MAEDTDALARVDEDADGSFHLVADEAANFRARINFTFAFNVDSDAAVGVFQVAVGCQRAQVDPLADISVTEKAIVILVTVAVNDALFNFTTDSADITDIAAFSDFPPTIHVPLPM